MDWPVACCGYRPYYILSFHFGAMHRVHHSVAEFEPLQEGRGIYRITHRHRFHEALDLEGPCVGWDGEEDCAEERRRERETQEQSPASAEELNWPSGRSAPRSGLGEAPITLPRPMIDSGTCDFSFAGLKTAVLTLTGLSDTVLDQMRKVGRFGVDGPVTLLPATENLFESTEKGYRSAAAWVTCTAAAACS